jgi:OOP family OmpA-OmpF porin
MHWPLKRTSRRKGSVVLRQPLECAPSFCNQGQRTMKHRTLLLGLMTLAATAASTANAAPDRGFYVGAGVGTVNVKDDASGFDDGDTGFKVFGGYVLNEILAVELSYIDGGTAEDSGAVFDPFFGVGTAALEIDTSIINLSVIGDLLLTEQFSLFGRLGYAFIDTDVDATARFGNFTATASDSDTSNEFSYGVGAVYRLTEQFEVRAEFEGLDVSNGDLNAITASALFRF